MSIKLVRKTNDQTSQDKYIVTNVDDTRMIRYAYNGYSGYVKGVGNELKYSYNDTTFTIDTGLIVIDGWEIYIAEGGESIDLGYLSGYAAHSIYVELNANTEEAVIKVVSASVADASKDFPAIDKGNDLTVASAGTARLLLYNVLCQSGVILEDTIIKQVREIPRLDTLLEEDRLTFKKATSAGTASSANNVSKTINNVPLTEIFEDDGKSVKVANHATKATKANEAISAEILSNTIDVTNAIFEQNGITAPGVFVIYYFKGNTNIDNPLNSYRYTDIIAIGDVNFYACGMKNEAAGGDSTFVWNHYDGKLEIRATSITVIKVIKIIDLLEWT